MNRATVLAVAATTVLPLHSPTGDGARGRRPTDVVVVNSKTRPVPVAIQEPVTIEGAVAVSNTPNVAVVAMPSLSIGGEVGVRDLDAGHRQPVTITLNADVPPGAAQTTCPTTLYSVPTGKRLVIEFVGGWAVSEKVQSANVAIIPVSSGSADFQFFFERKGTSQIGSPLYGFAQTTRLYSDPGGVVQYCVARSNEAAFADFYGYRLRLTGYLVDVS